MMQITPDLLNETLNLVALARETALNKGDLKKAEHFRPIEQGLRELINTEKKNQEETPSILSNNPSIQTLVEAANDPGGNGTSRAAVLERNRIVASMTAGGMDELEIARHLGMTREEVRMISKINQFNKSAHEEEKND